MGFTIRSSGEIDRVFRTGRRATRTHSIVLVSDTPPGRGPRGRVAFIAGKRIGGAVQRNRSRRVLRAAVRRLGGPWPGYDVCLMAREATREAAPEEIDESVMSGLRGLGVIE